MADWYVGQGGQQRGPLSEADLRAMIARGEVAPTDLVWKDGMAEWKAANAVPELRPAPAAPAAPPPPAYAPPPPPVPAPPPAPVPVADTSAWYIGRSGQQLGPYSTADIQRMAAAGQVAATDMLWKEGIAQWLPIASIPELAAYGRPGAPGMPPAGPYAPAGPSPVGVFFSNFIKDTKGVIADPDKGLEEAADRKSITFAITWIALKVIFAGLLALQLHASLSRATSLDGAFEALGRAMAGGGAGFGSNAFATFLKTMLLDAIHVGIVFGALMLVMAGILRTADAFPKALAIIGLSYIPVVAIMAVAFVLGWLHPWFRGLEGAIEPARIILFYLLFQHTTQQPRRVAVLCVIAILFGCALVGGAIPAF
ncbi:MAG TPA: DUF4339 domain-containing protein [Planctomycetota bacterium]|nr:DUF4339 domain-containing protein [Planctomycetota bacterium]